MTSSARLSAASRSSRAVGSWTDWTRSTYRRKAAVSSRGPSRPLRRRAGGLTPEWIGGGVMWGGPWGGVGRNVWGVLPTGDSIGHQRRKFASLAVTNADEQPGWRPSARHRRR